MLGRRRLHRWLVSAVAVALVAAMVVSVELWVVPHPKRSVVRSTLAPPGRDWRPPPIRHVFVIMLENESYGATFGDPASDPYLARVLPRMGALLENYYAIGHNSADNYIGFISGQPPNQATQQDCTTYAPWRGSARPNRDGDLAGVGCVYPRSVTTLANQLTAKGLSWKGYLQDMGNDPSRETATCGHPAPGRTDRTQTAVAGDGYATRHDPFVYFESVLGPASYCARHVVPLGTTTGVLPASAPRGVTGLATDLRSEAATPNFSFIVPNLCNDGHDIPCLNQHGSPSALTNIDRFLGAWVPLILRSPAFRANGLLEITFDESDGPSSDSRACCGETPGPGDPPPGLTGPGGGRVGAVLVSPYIRPGTRSIQTYNHYSSLASIEELFGLGRLAEARTVTATFGPDVFGQTGRRS